MSEAFLEHYGVKGMKWGVRKERDRSDRSSRLSPEAKKRITYGVIAAGTLTVAAGAAYAAKRYGFDVNVKDIKDVSQVRDGASAAKKVVDEQTDVIHLTRGKNVGFHFLKSGGLEDAYETYSKAFGDEMETHGDSFKKVGDKIAITMSDPDNRKDFSGRTVPHQFILPKSMSDGIESVDDFKTKIWPKLADDYSKFYPMTSEEWNRLNHD